MRTNLFDNIPETLPAELTDILFNSENIRIERIVSSGQTSPKEGWFDQEEKEWVILLQGEATIAFDDGLEIVLSKGDYLMIHPHKKHKVTFTSTEPKCVWLAIFF